MRLIDLKFFPLCATLVCACGCAPTVSSSYTPDSRSTSHSYSPSSPAPIQTSDLSTVAGYTTEIDRIQAISDPSQRADANLAFVKSLIGNLNASMVGAGINPNDMAYQSNYDAARKRGMTPYEADAEAKQFQQAWQQMSR